ncbi:MAG: isoprenylcysteine carboxylmethyltransferase family protein [archaeon GB-1867-035]|nr:isoprenylcysteine carboxylmethyltransferase family protein [Candidatus Culexmicrobium profundum]
MTWNYNYLLTGIILTCLISKITALNKAHRAGKGKLPPREEWYAEHPSPGRKFLVRVGEFFVWIFWLELIVYPALLSINLISPYPNLTLNLLGLTLFTAGFLLQDWSIIARGRYLTDWEMPSDHRLVTWGPYKYIRHPYYTGYFLMFIGWLILWLKPSAILPILSIPAIIYVAGEEEKLLVKRFGSKYIEYMEKTGKFLPK